MAVIITNPVPASSVVKRVICSNCGVELSYTPNDVKVEYIADFTGTKDRYATIECANCKTTIQVS